MIRKILAAITVSRKKTMWLFVLVLDAADIARNPGKEVDTKKKRSARALCEW